MEENRRAARRITNRVCFRLIVYNILIMCLHSSLTADLLPIPQDYISAVMVPVGVAVIYLVYLRDVRAEQPFAVKKQMTVSSFFCAFGLLCAGTFCASMLMLVLSHFGVQGNDLSSILLNSLTPGLILYAAITGPISEELIYRGMTAGPLSRIGKVPGILISGLLFGLMHANVTQLVSGFMMGAIFAYVYVEYSLWWAIALHFINNAILAIVPQLLRGPGGPLEAYAETMDHVIGVVLGIGALVGIVLAVKKRPISRLLKDPEAHGEPGSVRGMLSSFWFWAFTVIYIVLGLIVSYAPGVETALQMAM